jgi:hypothetical protein
MQSASLATPYPKPVLLAPARRPLVMVLGMHRSGTSLCSHLLSVLGVDMADQLGPFGKPSPDNARGHWERWEIVALHDRVLELLNRKYFEPTHDFGFPVAWWADPEVAKVRNEIVDFLRARMGEARFGFKDPRTVRLMPLWHQIASELMLAPKFVFCLRNPAAVARSLKARDNLAPEIGEARWFTYVLDFFRYNREAEFCLIEYETWFTDPKANTRKLMEFLDLEWRQSEAELDLVVTGVIDRELRHDEPAIAEAKQPLVRSLYRLARRAHSDAAARAEIQNLAAQFVSFQQLQSGIYRGFEEIAAAARAASVFEQEAAALRQAALGHDEALRQGQAELSTLQARLHAAEQQCQEQEASLAASRSEITRLHEGALSASQAEISRLQEALFQVELQKEQREARIAASQAEVARLQNALFQVELLKQECETALAENQAEIARIRVAAAQGETEWRGRASSLQSELDGLREAVRSTQHAVSVHEANAEALKAEIAELREELAAARQVGRSLLGALREPS